MKTIVQCLTATCLATLLVSAYAHDTNGLLMHGKQNGNNGMFPARYNPWRTQPGKTWGNAGNNAPQVQVLPSAPQFGSYPVHPLHVRQAEYQGYLNQYGVRSGSYNSGLPWWSDPVAVPYGPWALGNGWPNGIW